MAESAVLGIVNDVVDAAFEKIKENKLKKVREGPPLCACNGGTLLCMRSVCR